MWKNLSKYLKNKKVLEIGCGTGKKQEIYITILII